MIAVPNVLTVAVAVTFCALSAGTWQRSSAPSGAGIVLDALMITVLIVLQNTALCKTFQAIVYYYNLTRSMQRSYSSI